jgi:hypothetical protein
MSRNQRIGLIVAALVVAVVAFVIARSGGDSDDEQQAAQTTTAQTETGSDQDDGATTEETQTEAEPPPPKPEVTRIQIRGGTVVGGSKRIEAPTGDQVRIVIASDAPDELHLHGYDITREAGPGQPARFQFKANLEGVFELESHTAEDAGMDPLVAELVVQPS